MYDKELVGDILLQIVRAVETVRQRFASIFKNGNGQKIS